MKVKINKQEFEYGQRDNWGPVLQKVLNDRMLVGFESKMQFQLDILAYQEGIVDTGDKLPANVLYISLIDAWGVQYRHEEFVYEFYPEILPETEILSLIDQYFKDFEKFRTGHPWKRTGKLAYEAPLGRGITILVVVVLLGILVMYLKKYGLFDLARNLFQ